ncbi:hypothetical protein [Streptacidiphilus rugosus]|uniref:hypothetical protein n=1 Tax=Streptacidiphilus rugosus TaxID=405783 RepID=UPI000B2456E6|nr:hypothetical protein [Streptacidiphilus rugosus]
MRSRSALRNPVRTQLPLHTVLGCEEEALDPPVYLAQTATVGAEEDSAWREPDWTQAAAARVVDALGERRLLEAAWAARTLLWDAERAFGPNSSQLWHATELLAHVCHEIGDDVRAVQLYARAAHGWAQNFGAGHWEARAAYDRARALWSGVRAAGTTHPATALQVASLTRLFARTGVPSCGR